MDVRDFLLKQMLQEQRQLGKEDGKKEHKHSQPFPTSNDLAVAASFAFASSSASSTAVGSKLEEPSRKEAEMDEDSFHVAENNVSAASSSSSSDVSPSIVAPSLDADEMRDESIEVHPEDSMQEHKVEHEEEPAAVDDLQLAANFAVPASLDPTSLSKPSFVIDRRNTKEELDESSSEEDSSDDDSDLDDDELPVHKDPSALLDGDEDDDENDLMQTASRMRKLTVLEDNLPPVVPVEVVLSPDHTISPVGCVSAIIENVIIVQANAGAQAVDEESIFCDGERRILGRVWDTFGPVAQPLYTIRFNDSSEIDAEAWKVGTIVYSAEGHTSFVLPAQSKGTDASWKDDEEVPAEEEEYSDDEEEAAARRANREKRKNNVDSESQDGQARSSGGSQQQANKMSRGGGRGNDSGQQQAGPRNNRDGNRHQRDGGQQRGPFGGRNHQNRDNNSHSNSLHGAPRHMPYPPFPGMPMPMPPPPGAPFLMPPIFSFPPPPINADGSKPPAPPMPPMFFPPTAPGGPGYMLVMAPQPPFPSPNQRPSLPQPSPSSLADPAIVSSSDQSSGSAPSGSVQIPKPVAPPLPFFMIPPPPIPGVPSAPAPMPFMMSMPMFAMPPQGFAFGAGPQQPSGGMHHNSHRGGRGGNRGGRHGSSGNHGNRHGNESSHKEEEKPQESEAASASSSATSSPGKRFSRLPPNRRPDDAQ